MSECRFCRTPLRHTLVDLAVSPLANAYIKPSGCHKGEVFYPLRAFVCEACFLVQLEKFEAPEHIFSDYAYFSSYSDSWLEHARNYVEKMIADFAITRDHQVVEIASNDGYLLQYFVAQGIPVLGVEPAANVAEAAHTKQIPTLVRFFGVETARMMLNEGISADLLIANNVLAHVPDLNDFVAGMRLILAPEGVATIEFPHLLRLIEERQFDTIYHEHFSYFSLTTARRVLAHHGLTVFDVEELPTHGGSLRLYVCRSDGAVRPETARVKELLEREDTAGLQLLATYSNFEAQVKALKQELLAFLIEVKRQGKRVVGYGAPAKGNTLLNYCGIRSDFLDFTVDRNPHKQGHLLPGTHIPIEHPDRINEIHPDYVLILPWNLKDEIISQMAYIREWGGRFVVPIPQVQIYS